MTMTTLAVWASLLVALAPAQAPTKPPTQSITQTVSLVDLLVEGQTLYTMAVDKEPESLTAALELVRQAQTAVSDDTVRRRLLGGVRPDPQDLTVLGALRARISILAGSIEKKLAEDYRTQADTAKYLGLADDAIKLYRRAQAIDPTGADYDALCQEARDRASFFSAKSKEIRGLLESRRLSSAAREMAAVEPLLPIDETLYQAESLRTDIRARQKELSATVQAAETAMTSREYATAERLWREAASIDHDQLFEDPIRRAQELGKASHPKGNKTLLKGIVWTAVLAGSGVAVHEWMTEKQGDLYYYPPGSSEWRNAYDDAERLRLIRNGLYAAAIGVGTGFAIYGAVRANRSPARSFVPSGPRTQVGFNFDPRRPAFTVVRVF